MEKISGVYKITNTVTNDFYIGSSNDVKRRWAEHKCKSAWNKQPNNPMYIDMQKYGIDKFVFEILAEVEVDKLKETEQQFIETLNPAYNKINANGLDVEKQKKYQKEYEKSDKRKEYKKEYEKSDKRKEYKKEYDKSEKRRKYHKEYDNQLCCFNNETLILHALSERFRRAGIPHPTLEAKKYLVQ